MATSVIMPALEMAQETGLLVRWLKHEGEPVQKGDPVMEIETDKVTLEIEAAASGILGGILVKEGDVVPVGRTIAWILEPGEKVPASLADPAPAQAVESAGKETAMPMPLAGPIEASPLARRIAAEHAVDLTRIRPDGKRIEKADVLAYIQEESRGNGGTPPGQTEAGIYRLTPASPKARRLASEKGLALGSISGSGPGGAVLSSDILSSRQSSANLEEREGLSSIPPQTVGPIWRTMVERVTSSWTRVPHFYLAREADATGLVQWRRQIAPEMEREGKVKLTYTDLLVRLLAFTLVRHPRLNAAWDGNSIRWNQEVNIALAIAVEEGLVAPIIPRADRTDLRQIAIRRQELVLRAQSRALRPEDITGGTFTLSNLGMYHVDAFQAIINPPQSAILAVGQIADRVLAVDGQPVVRPTIILTLSCDHRVVDGARGAQFLDDLTQLIENPWRLLI